MLRRILIGDFEVGTGNFHSTSREIQLIKRGTERKIDTCLETISAADKISFSKSNLRPIHFHIIPSSQHSIMPSTVAQPEIAKLSLKNPSLPIAEAGPSRQWNIKLSPAAATSHSAIRSLVASLSSTKTHPKPLINLGLGDPTVFGLHSPPPASTEGIQEALMGGKDNGYVPGSGTKHACDAVAAYHKKWDGVDYNGDDVTLVSGDWSLIGKSDYPSNAD